MDFHKLVCWQLSQLHIILFETQWLAHGPWVLSYFAVLRCLMREIVMIVCCMSA